MARPSGARVMVTTHKSASAQGVVDPVCDMTIDPADAVGHSDFKGQTYYFCSAGCKRSFDKDPEKYIGKATAQAEPAA